MSDRIVIIAGGLTPERDVSLRSGRRVAEELRAVGLTAEVHDIDATMLTDLRDDPPMCVIPLVHGAAGEDGSLQEVLQALHIPYVGSDDDACRRSYDKAVAGALVQDGGLHFPPSVALPQSMFRDLGAGILLEAITAELGLPLVVKPNRGGSALGLTIVHEPQELPAAMVGAFAYGDMVLIQKYVAGTEVAVAIAETDGGPIALPPVEIVPDSGLYDFAARYTAGTTEFFVPARLPQHTLRAAEATALAAHRILGLRDWSRSDIIVDAEGIPWFLEVNVAPGMTETSLYPQAVAAVNRRIGDLIADLIKHAVGRD
ncbi:MAG: D-alanine--D-alanine ligase [Actinomycetes bacterium]